MPSVGMVTSGVIISKVDVASVGLVVDLVIDVVVVVVVVVVIVEIVVTLVVAIRFGPYLILKIVYFIFRIFYL